MLESEKTDHNGWKYGRTSGDTRDYHLFYGNRNGEVAVSCHYTFATNADSLGVDKTETLVCGSSFYSISLLSGPTLVGFINDSYALWRYFDSASFRIAYNLSIIVMLIKIYFAGGKNHIL